MNRRDGDDYDARFDEDQCDHRNAEVQYLDYAKPTFWQDAGIWVNDDSETLATLVCPDCGHEEIMEHEEEDDYEPERD